MEQNQRSVSLYLIPTIGVLCLTPYVSSALALVVGIFVAVIGVVGLHGVGYTVVGIASTLLLGYLIGKLLSVERNTSALVCVGTAICGGSAIAAIAPTIHAKPNEISISLGVIFMLNALALVIFPAIGEHFQLTQHQFGLWAALAIHDTSSVVGASMHYGAEALKIGTTVKLARALWIVPVTLLFGFLFARGKNDASGEKPKRPWFILGFLLMAAIVTWIPVLQPAGQMVNEIAKRALVLTLFLIGSNLTKEAIRSVGIKPLVQGISLWLFVATATLSAIIHGWIA